MATLALGGGGSSLAGIVGNNAVTSALGLTTSESTPLAFATKFGAGSVFQTSSLAYQVKARNNFEVYFNFFPRRSQIRTYFANAFTAEDTDDIRFLVRSVRVPPIGNRASPKEDGHLVGAIPGRGVNGEGALNIEILSTEFSFVDHVFYQWLCETESPFWIYAEEPLRGNYIPYLNKYMYKQYSDTQYAPFTRADITVQYYSSNNKPLHSVVFYGAFPVRIEPLSVDNEMKFNSGANVTFDYDSVVVSSPFVAKKGDWGAAATSALSDFSNTAPWTSTIQDDALSNYLNRSFLRKASGFMNSITNKVGGNVSGALNKAQKALGV